MIYIKLNEDKTLSITQMDSLYRGEHFSEKAVFLVPKTVGDIDILSSKIYLSYIRPDEVGDIAILVRQEQMYNADYYQFIAPITCKLTKFPGRVCIWLNIMSGNCCPPITIKSGECYLPIEDSKNMDDYLCDHQLTAIYQLHKQLDGGSSDNTGSNDDIYWDDIDKDDSGSDSGTTTPDDSNPSTPSTPTEPENPDDSEEEGDFWESFD